MSSRLIAVAGLGACVALVSACGGSSDASSSADSSKGPIKVTLITKATGGFWDAMIAGGKKYATDHPDQVALTTLACKTNDDTPCQIAQIQDSVTKGAKAIVVSPWAKGSSPPCRRPSRPASRSCSSTTPCPGSPRTPSRRPTTSRAGRRPAPTSRASSSPATPSGCMEAVKGVPALDARIDGVKKALEGTGVKVVMGGQQTTCDPKIGAAVTQDLLTKYPDLTAVYSACDSPAVGASTVAKQKNHPLKIYGYDGDPEMSKLILAGDTTATMAQSPFKMTNLGIAAAVNALQGKPFEKSIDTGVTLVTKDNADQFKDAWQ